MKFKKFISCIIAVLIAASFVNFNYPLKVQASVSSWQRLDGADRYQTAIRISKQGWDRSDTVVIATGEDYPDALYAAPLAKRYNAPILLVGGGSDSLVLDEIRRLGASRAFLIGGTGVISRDTENKIRAIASDCMRIGGVDRYETSAMVAERLGNVSEAVIATGDNYPDALSIAPVAAKKSIPILLSDKDKIPDSINKYIGSHSILKWYVIGGTGVIGDKVIGSLKDAERIYGPDRYGTNTAVLKRFLNELDFSTTYIATGENFPDALSGSALAPLTSSPILLTYDIPYESTLELAGSVLRDIKYIYVLGGMGVVPNSTVTSIIYSTGFYSLVKQGMYEYTANVVLKNTGKTPVQNVNVEINIGGPSDSPYHIEGDLSVAGPGVTVKNTPSGGRKAVISLNYLAVGQTVNYTIKRSFKNSGIEYGVDLSNTSGDYRGFDDYLLYTSPGNKIESDNPLIKQKAAEIAQGEKNPFIIARKIFEYVNTTIDYDYSEANKGALNALKTKKGVCEDFSDLFVALARALGVPSRVVSGYWVQDIKELNSANPMDVSGYGHAWPEFYLPEYGWIPAEPTYIIIDAYDNRVPAFEAFANLNEPGHIIWGYDSEPAYLLHYEYQSGTAPNVDIDLEEYIKKI